VLPPAAGGGGAVVGDAAGWTVTVCSGVDLRLPAACALARSRCTASIVSFCWARNASPSFCVQSSFSLIISMTGGKLTRDFTLSSQSCSCSFALSWSPLRLAFALAKRAAWTISTGYVDAMKICAMSGSG
jgi:hypothetical protein